MVSCLFYKFSTCHLEEEDQNLMLFPASYLMLFPHLPQTEFVLIILGKSRKELKKRRNVLQLIFILISALTTFLWFASKHNDFQAAMVTTATLALLVRVPFHFPFAHGAVNIFAACIPVMLTLVAILIVVM